MSSFSDFYKGAMSSEERKKSGSYYKYETGENKFRILSRPVIYFENSQFDENLGICYTGCGFTGKPRAKAYVLDRRTGQIQLADIKTGMLDKLVELESDDEYEFDGTFPMRFDMKVNKTGAGKNTEYTYTPSPAVSPVPEDILADLREKKSVEEIVEDMKAKNKEVHIAAGTYPYKGNATTSGTPVEQNSEGEPF